MGVLTIFRTPDGNEIHREDLDGYLPRQSETMHLLLPGLLHLKVRVTEVEVFLKSAALAATGSDKKPGPGPAGGKRNAATEATATGATLRAVVSVRAASAETNSYFKGLADEARRRKQQQATNDAAPEPEPEPAEGSVTHA